MQTQSLNLFTKIIFVLALAALLAIFSYLQTVFGWTNPTQNPPNGSGVLSAYQGRLGINVTTPSTTLTVNGVISAAGNLIKDVATPIAGTDAANKAYVDAQSGGSGSGAGSIVLYGLSNGTGAGGFSRPGGALPNCYRNVYTGGTNCAANPVTTVPAGSGAPNCPEGWTETYAGYGPFGKFITWYGGSTDPDENNPPQTAAAATYSVCATSAFLNIDDAFNTQAGTNNVTNAGSYLSACVTNGSQDRCNTCRVCIK